MAGLSMPVMSPGLQPAQANPVQDLIVRQARPELEKDQAIVMLMDAKSTLTELSVRAASCASVCPDSECKILMRQRTGCPLCTGCHLSTDPVLTLSAIFNSL